MARPDADEPEVRKAIDPGVFLAPAQRNRMTPSEPRVCSVDWLLPTQI